MMPVVRTGIARAAALLVVLTGLSQLLGFGRDVVVAAVFGAGAELDAYLVAQGLMNLVLALVAGAVARALVPTASRAAAAGDVDRANRTARTLLTLTAVVLLVGSAVMVVLARPLVGLLAPGFDASTAELAVRLSRIVLLAALFVAATDILAAYAQSHGRFFFSGVQGVAFNVVMIGAAAGLGPWLGIDGLAIGFVIGSVVRFVLQLPPVRAVGLRLVPRWHVRDPDVVEVLRLVPALLVGSAVTSVNTLVDRAVGSAQGEGVISALNFAWRVVTLVDSLLVVTVVAALYPAFGAAAAGPDRTELRSLADRSYRVVLLLIAPVVAFLVVAARPVVAVLFGRGGFDAEAVTLTATAVTAFSLGALALGLRSLASRVCLAVGDSRGPVVAGVVAMVVNVVGDLTLGVRYGIVGIAASTTLSLVVAALMVLWRVSSRHDALSGGAALRSLLRVAVAASVAGLVGAGVLLLLGQGPAVAGWAALGRSAACLVAGGLAYVTVLLALRSPELDDTWGVVRLRLLRR